MSRKTNNTQSHLPLMRGSLAPIRVTAAYIVTLALYAVPAVYPHHHLWSVNWWAYFPVYIPVGLLVIGLALIVLVPRLIKTDSITGGAYHLVSAITVAVFALLFWLLRAQTHYLGDGYQLLSRLASDNPLIKPWSYGGIAAPYWLSQLIGDGTEMGVLLSYQIISIISGIVLVFIVLATARKLFENYLDRLLFLWGAMTAGTSLLFFGYVENYALFVLSVFAFALVGLLAAKKKTSPLWLAPLLLLAVFFHLFGLILLPAMVYLLFSGSRFGDWTAGRSSGVKWIGGLAILSALAIVFWYLYTTRYFFRFSFVPLVTNRFTVEGYTLFSFQHILDWLGLIILLLPGVLVVAVALFGRSWRKILTRREYRFFLVLLVCALAAVFILDPKLGMPRDWDLFSLAGVPLALLAFYALLDPERVDRRSRSSAVAAVALGLLVLLPRAFAHTDHDMAEAHLKSYFAHDRAKNIPVRTVWISYLKNSGRTERAIEETRKMHRECPEISLADSAWALVHEKKYAEALVGFRKVVEMNPMKANSWAGIGNCLSELGQPDSALKYLYISDGLSPYRWVVYNHLGYAYYRLQEYDSAETHWRKALRLDSDLRDPLIGLGTMYARQGRIDEYAGIFFRLAVQDDVAVGNVSAQVGRFMKLGYPRYARRAFEIAVRRGADSSAISNLIREYPELSRVYRSLNKAKPTKP